MGLWLPVRGASRFLGEERGALAGSPAAPALVALGGAGGKGVQADPGWREDSGPGAFQGNVLRNAPTRGTASHAGAGVLS